MKNATYFDTTIGSAYSTDGGKTWRWSSNHAVVPVDACQTYEIPADMAAQQKARQAETTAFLKEYCGRKRQYSAEDVHEMRAAFGCGTTVVNVITGQKVRL